ncbi:hypothetical protein JHK84_035576 [Glycine max]|nr:hypothetical protein JHK84_035576 [Glycine max]
MKTQFTTDFLTEFAGNNTTTSYGWTLYVGSASNIKGSKAGIILEGPNNIILELALKLNFRASNNQADVPTTRVGWQSNSKNMERHPLETKASIVVALRLLKPKVRPQ